jgi:hypothetical protein
VCARSDNMVGFSDLLQDPLIRLVMRSDGVTRQDMIVLMAQLRHILAAREEATWRSERAGRGKRRATRRLQTSR